MSLSFIPFLLLLVGSRPTSGYNTTTVDPSDAFNDFDWALTKLALLGENSTCNVIFSPISVKLVLGLLNEGAGGKTSEQLQKVLNLQNEKTFPTNRLSLILQSLQASNTGYEIAVGSKLFVDNGTVAKPEFVEKVKNLYNASVEEINFKNVSEAVDLINLWVKAVTRGHIHDLLSQKNTDQNTVMLLVNALYFKGLWVNPFSANQTKQGRFYQVNSSVTVDYMSGVHKVHYLYDEDLKMRIIRLPYVGNKFAMYIMLPFENDGLSHLMKEVTPDKIRSLMGKMTRETVCILLPKFDFEYAISLAPILKQMGITEAFAPTANFNGISDGHKDLIVTNVIQKTGLEVNEQGSTAYAATAVELEDRFGTVVEVFEADHPFALFIMDETTKAIAFLARVSNPSQSGKSKIKENEALNQLPLSVNINAKP